MESIILEIEYLNEKGYGVAIKDDREYFILNALPGEEVKAKLLKRKNGIRYGIALDILKASSDRISPKEEHFLSCSPLQIVSPNEELLIKKDILKRLFSKHAEIKLDSVKIQQSLDLYGYRNKMEFSIYAHEDEHLDLALHKRDTNKALNIVEGCMLAPDNLNKAVQSVLEFLNSHGIQKRQIKGVIARYSFFEAQSVITIVLKDKDIKLDADDFNKLKDIKGLEIVFSDPKSPAFVFTEKLSQFGDTDLVEKIGNFKFIYPSHGFFQINPTIFNITLADIQEIIKTIPDHKNKTIVDLYSGVGTIGISIADLVKSVIAVELFEESRRYAVKNAKLNSVSNFQLIEGKSENKGLEVLSKADILIVDPPRSGLHPKLIDEIKTKKPEYFIYLSCNPKTQAQDLNTMKDIYEIKLQKAYNYFPRTPHIENLLVLKAK